MNYPKPRIQPVFACFNNSLFMLGGGDFLNHYDYLDIEYFDLGWVKRSD